MAWDETKFQMTADGGGDLVLDEGCDTGYFDTGKIDIGSLNWWTLHVVASVDDNPATTGSATYTLTWSYSADDATYTDYQPIEEGQYYCRYYYLRCTVYGDPATGQRPKITALEASVVPSDAKPTMPPVQAEQNAPPSPAVLGESYIVGVGSGAWTGHNGEIALPIETTTPTWRFITPRPGMFLYDENDAIQKICDAGSVWRECDARKTAAPHITLLPAAYDHVDAGTWAITADTAQVLNGYIENATGGAPANADQLTWKTGLKADTYTLVLWGVDDADCGILKIYLDSTLVATFDTYQAAPAKNQRNAATGIVVSVAKVYEVIVKVDGKNGSSTGYKAYISHISIWPE